MSAIQEQSKSNAKANFDETIVRQKNVLGLGLDHRESQINAKANLRSVLGLPSQCQTEQGNLNGLRYLRKGRKLEEAKDAGADLFGGENLVEQILAGNIELQSA